MRLARRSPLQSHQNFLMSCKEEVLDYKLPPQSDIPDVDKEGHEDHELRSYWQFVGEMKTLCGSYNTISYPL